MNWKPVGSNHFQTTSADDRVYDLRATSGKHPWVLTATSSEGRPAVKQEIGSRSATDAKRQAELWIETAKYVTPG